MSDPLKIYNQLPLKFKSDIDLTAFLEIYDHIQTHKNNGTLESLGPKEIAKKAITARETITGNIANSYPGNWSDLLQCDLTSDYRDKLYQVTDIRKHVATLTGHEQDLYTALFQALEHTLDTRVVSWANKISQRRDGEQYTEIPF